jgi:hypothetical protein
MAKSKRKRTPKTILKLPEPRAVQVRSAEQPEVAQFTAFVRTRDSGLYRLVLLGTAAGIQQNRGHPLPHCPGAGSICSVDDQPETCGSPTTRVRGCGLRLLESRAPAVIRDEEGRWRWCDTSEGNSVGRKAGIRCRRKSKDAEGQNTETSHRRLRNSDLAAGERSAVRGLPGGDNSV